MTRKPVVGLVLLALVLPAPATAELADGPALGPEDQPVQQAVDWLLEDMDKDGCIDGFSARTDWAAQAAVAVGRDIHAGEPSLVDGLAACPPEPPGLNPPPAKNYPADLARHILALVAAGEDPRSFGGQDWIDELRDTFDGVQFQAQNHLMAINDDMFAIMALRAAGVPASDNQLSQSASFVADNQNGDGGWAIATSGPNTDSMTDMTGAALVSLEAADRLTDDARTQALGFLEGRAGAGSDGCLDAGPEYGTPSVDATAWALLGLLATHRDPRADPWGVAGGPWGCLLANQGPEGGFGNRGTDNNLTTPHAVLALTGLPWGQMVADLQRPSASLSTSHDPVVGEPVDLIADGAAFAGWQTEDGKLLEGARTEWWPQTAGQHTFEVLLVGEDGVASLETTTIHVQQASDQDEGSGEETTDDPSSPQGSTGTPPSASLAPPATADRNVATQVTVEADPGDAQVVAYRLAWGDGTRTGWSGQPSFEHTYTALGEHELQAWAKDADGDVSQAATASLEVVDASPRITAKGPETAHRHALVNLTAEASDPDGPAPEVTWAWPTGQANGSTVAITLAEPGPVTLEATATDQAGNTARATYELLVLNRAPRIEDVGPLTAEPNTTHPLTVEASDPDGDDLTITWQAGGQTAYGGQYHLETGPPGDRTLSVNVTDPYGAWATATITVDVTQDPAGSQADPPSVERRTPRQDQANGSAERSDEGQRPTVDLPASIQGQPSVATILEGQATDPDSPVTAVEVVLGDPVPARGTSAFQALLPALPEGTYPVSARAADGTGWGPWSNATLVVAPADSEDAHPSEPLAKLGDPAGEAVDAVPLPPLTPLVLTAAAVLLARRRSP